jgi:TatD DNase family protein
VGETGLDFYRDRAEPEDQRRAFAAQIEIARRTGRALVIHLRDREGSEQAVSEAFTTLEERAEGTDVILHCFSAGPRWAERAAERGWYCSFAGNLTFPKAEALREAAALVREDRLLVETDSPFLAPQPVRGKPNQPANVVRTAERLAEVRGVTYGEIERIVEANAARVFGW